MLLELLYALMILFYCNQDIIEHLQKSDAEIADKKCLDQFRKC